MPDAVVARSVRARSFGAVADDYERFRPGPSPEVAAWFLERRVPRVVDLGAGTGALTRLLVGRADEVVAVEPDARMRAVLSDMVPDAVALEGDSEHIPLPDGSVDAVVVSSAWHWMEPEATIREVGRVLRPRGLLGVVWAGVDWESGWLKEARRLMRGESGTAPTGDHDAPRRRPRHVLELPPAAPFDPPEHQVLRWSHMLTIDGVVGMLGTYSMVITRPQQERNLILEQARDLLRSQAPDGGSGSLAVAFRASCWRAVRRAGD